MELNNVYCVSRSANGIFVTRWHGEDIPFADAANIVAWMLVMLEHGGYPIETILETAKQIKDGLGRDSLFHPLINFESRYPARPGKG